MTGCQTIVRRHRWLLLSALLGACSSARHVDQPVPSRQTPHIDGAVEISTRTDSLSARVTYRYVAGDSAEPAIVVNLARAYQLREVDCSICASYKFDREPRLPLLTIALTRPLAPHEGVDLRLAYRGPLEEAWDSAHAYVELGLDNSWFPTPPDVTSHRFTYRMAVHTDLANPLLVSNGRVQKTGDGWTVESTVPDIDIDLVMSPRLQLVADSSGGYDLRVASVNPTEDDAPALIAHMRNALAFLNPLLGAQDPLVRVTAVVRPFSVEGQGGYARNGYFVMTKSRNTGDDLHYVAHELSHHWWLRAPRRHAWLNESFAEYTAMMAIRKILGQAAFDTLLAEKKRRSEGLPPIYGFDRTAAPRLNPSMMYGKGPVLLNELETQLGAQQFVRFLQEVVTAQVKDTDALIEVLARVASREVANQFLARLKQ